MESSLFSLLHDWIFAAIAALVGVVAALLRWLYARDLQNLTDRIHSIGTEQKKLLEHIQHIDTTRPLRSELSDSVEELRSEVAEGIQGLRVEIRTDINNLRSDVTTRLDTLIRMGRER